MDDLFIRSLSSLGYSENDTSLALCADLPSRIYRNSCDLRDNVEVGKLDGVAGVRMVSSLLGLMGACSIIVSAVLRRRVFSSEVHPIFMLSLAECLLSVLWITGSSLWLSDTSGSDTYNRILCYAITLSTGILECVAINLTLVYAILAYIRTKRTELHTFLVAASRRVDVSKKVIVIMYLVSWFLPVLIIVSVFVTTNSVFEFIKYAQDCSCWCRPTVINILPFAKSKDKESKKFMHRQSIFTLSLSFFISMQYVVVFILLVILYLKILFRIKALRKEFESRRNISNYGATTVIERGQSQARKRVVLFLTVFVASGFFNLCSEVFLLPFLVNLLVSHDKNGLESIYYTLLFAQSLTLPLQGFMNALVYGWTRDDFINIMTFPLDQEHVEEPEGTNNIIDPEGFERSFTDTFESDNSVHQDLLSQDAIQ